MDDIRFLVFLPTGLVRKVYKAFPSINYLEDSDGGILIFFRVGLAVMTEVRHIFEFHERMA